MQIETINSRLENAIQKGNETLKDTLKELLKEMKTDILKAVGISKEVTESKLFPTKKERDEIKKNIESITKYVESGKDTSETIRREVKHSEDRQKKAENKLEFQALLLILMYSGCSFHDGRLHYVALMILSVTLCIQTCLTYLHYFINRHNTTDFQTYL